MAKEIECPKCGEAAVPGRHCDGCGLLLNMQNIAAERGGTTVLSSGLSFGAEKAADPTVAAKAKPPVNGAKTVKACADCREEKAIVSRGLCGKCRSKHEKAGTLDTHYPAKRRGQQKPVATPPSVAEMKVEPIETESETLHPLPSPAITERAIETDNPPQKTNKTDNSIGKITVHFYERDQQLYRDLMSCSKYHRRPLASEVLFRLEHGEVQ